MSEQPTTPEAPVATEPEQTQGDPADLGDAGKKALAAERDARKAAEKSVADLAAKLKQIEDANLSELDKAKREAEDAKATLAHLTLENTRNAVALAKGVPGDLVEFLTGDNEEQIAKRADVLLARLNAPTTPKPDPSQGASGSNGKASTADSFAEFFNSHI